MKNKSLAYAVLSIAVVTGSASIIAPVAQAGVNVNLDIGVPPPVPRYEAVPAPREGFVWIQGFWGWDGNQHVWHEGHWEAQRRGYVYQPARWDRVGDRWRYNEGKWVEHKEERHEERGDHHDRDDR